MADRHLLPLRSRPRDGELISSWIVRLAYLHSVKVETLVTLLFGYQKPIWNRDIDRVAPAEILRGLSEATGVPEGVISGMLLKSYEGVIFEKFRQKALTSWLLPVGIYHRKRRRYGLQCCPICLLESSEPYYRRLWRIGFITSCLKHQVLLIDRCGNCGAPIAPFRYDMRSRGLYPTPNDIIRCHLCLEPLTSIEPHRASEPVLELQKNWEEAVSSGWMSWANNPSMYSHLFFEGLRALCVNMMRKLSRRRLRQYSEIELSSIGWPGLGLEYASTLDRHALFSAISNLLKDWPDTFITEATRSRLSYAYLKSDYASLPYWYENVIKKYLSRGSVKISYKERESICSVVESRFGKFSNSLARQISGRDFSKSNHADDRFNVSDGQVELFLASIDHEIAGTLDPVKRHELLRDKIMFGVARGLRLNQRELAELTIEKVHELVPSKTEASFFETPKSNVQARAWAEWYVNYTAQLRPDNCKNIFFSFRTKRGFNHRSICAKFSRVALTTKDQCRISSFSAFIKH